MRAECHDCHIPPDIPGMVSANWKRATRSTRNFIAYSIDTPEKFQPMRGTCQRAMGANERNIGNFTPVNHHAMDHAKQHPKQHVR
ncbi:NapC/NirT family cytochrome c [Shigella flexneri]